MNGARNHITDDLTIVFDTEDLLSTARFVHSINNCSTTNDAIGSATC
jgi:hypothetical protein